MSVTRWTLATAIAVGTGVLPTTAGGLDAADADRVVAGYFPEWAVYGRDYHVTNIPASLLTHVFYAFLRPVYEATNDTARIEIVDPFAALEKGYPGDTDASGVRGSFNEFRRLKAAHPHLRTLISVGGATLSADFSDIAASARAREAFAESCVAHAVQYGFDGIDIDWEFPVQGGEASVRHRPEDAANLALLLRSLRDRLDRQGALDGTRYLLTVAASISGSTLTDRYPFPEIGQDVDWINLMAYNLAGAWSPVTGHQAPLHANPRSPHRVDAVSDGITRYLRLGVPANKLVLGVPFYGRGFKGVPPEDHGLFQKHSGLCSEGSWSPGLFTYRDLRDGTRGHASINTNGFADFWDPVSRASSLYNEATRVFITYASPRSMEEKLDYVKQHRLRGMMCWSLDNDTRDHALLRCIRESSNGPD